MKTTKAKKNMRKGFYDRERLHICPNCKQLGRHFVMPCFGDPGFFTCDK